MLSSLCALLLVIEWRTCISVHLLILFSSLVELLLVLSFPCGVSWTFAVDHYSTWKREQSVVTSRLVLRSLVFLAKGVNQDSTLLLNDCSTGNSQVTFWYSWSSWQWELPTACPQLLQGCPWLPLCLDSCCTHLWPVISSVACLLCNDQIIMYFNKIFTFLPIKLTSDKQWPHWKIGDCTRFRS